MLVDVEFFHVPSKCEKCQVFGHNCSNPRGRTKKVWVVKQRRVKEIASLVQKDMGKSVIEIPEEYVVQPLGAGSSSAVEHGTGPSPVPVQDLGVQEESSNGVEEDGFQVVTHMKNRVRAPALGLHQESMELVFWFREELS
ncbi:unnamed protein product [Linum trigynum]